MSNFHRGQSRRDTSKDIKKASFLKTLQELGGTLGEVSSQISEDMVSEVTKLKRDIVQSVKSATDFGQDVVQSAIERGKTAQQETRQFFGNKLEQNQESLRKKLDENQTAKEAAARAHIELIDLDAVEKFVTLVLTKFPNATPEQMTQRLLRRQLFRVSRTSVVMSVVPSKMAESVGVDHVEIALIQAEIIFQIAVAYGFELQIPECKNEAFAILDRVLRANRLATIGLSATQIIPVAGGFINTGTDTYLVYQIGNTAQQFYKSLTEEEVPGETLEVFIEETQRRYNQRLW
ncbi:MAG: hypothetical protein KME49_20975 [Brasilonema octagenarum HA4186-MV1]|jgi:uncharacterized protein (DUF697 family)/DNA-binding transcriptional MerR regulator|uniref:Uncharacterized protein n=1 Tax=Brasilonema sennae CENA114 TaxID=415709 RepID=A0A856MDB6_9CYAN|nr:hypothetical protein [Brasilonema sennae]MBW4627911.1 hypothetical protein [Brasilonema octagenarum HA4186-MV1]QDL08698.1 hypothetical protein DP114_13080 [Brasilonema sennae CENA114]QDL15054.1 hypothetical protein DP113_13020 [Brasilonema octagenarum UFV-E1]